MLRVSIAISQAPTNNKWTFLLIWKSICHKIDNILFWGFSHSWGFSYSDRHLYPRAVEGLGLRRTDDLNKASISKFGWSVVSNADKTWVHLPKFNYLQDWRNQLLPTRKEFTTHFHCLITRVCLYHRIGSGSNSNILYMDWSWVHIIPNNYLHSSPSQPIPEINHLAELIIIIFYFLFFTPIHIQKIHIPWTPSEDFIVWVPKIKEALKRFSHLPLLKPKLRVALVLASTAANQGCKSILFEGDAKFVIDALISSPSCAQGWSIWTLI